MISHSNTLLPTSPQLIPGMSLSVCICLNCFPRRMAALEVPPGELPKRVEGDAMVAVVRRGEMRVCADGGYVPSEFVVRYLLSKYCVQQRSNSCEAIWHVRLESAV